MPTSALPAPAAPTHPRPCSWASKASPQTWAAQPTGALHAPCCWGHCCSMCNVTARLLALPVHRRLGTDRGWPVACPPVLAGVTPVSAAISLLRRKTCRRRVPARGTTAPGLAAGCWLCRCCCLLAGCLLAAAAAEPCLTPQPAAWLLRLPAGCGHLGPSQEFRVVLGGVSARAGCLLQACRGVRRPPAASAPRPTAHLPCCPLHQYAAPTWPRRTSVLIREFAGGTRVAIGWGPPAAGRGA